MTPKLSTDYKKKINILIKILQSFLCKYKLNYILGIYFCESQKTVEFQKLPCFKFEANLQN